MVASNALSTFLAVSTTLAGSLRYAISINCKVVMPKSISMVRRSTRGFNGVTISEITSNASPKKLSNTEPTSKVTLCRISVGSPISKLLPSNKERLAFSSCAYSRTRLIDGKISPTDVATCPYRFASAFALAFKITLRSPAERSAMVKRLSPLLS